MKQHYPTRARAIARLLCSLFLLSISVSTLYSQNRTLPTDHFRSRVSGNWSTPATWESSADNLNWVIATDLPTSSCSSVTIMSGDSVYNTTEQSAKDLIIESGGILTINNTFSINDTVGVGLTVFGKIELNYYLSTSTLIVIKDGGCYLKDISKNIQLNLCTWEDGSTLRLTGSTISQLINLNQDFHNFYWDGKDQQGANYTLNLPNGFHITGDFTICATNSRFIYLTSSLTPVTFSIDGSITLNKAFVSLSSSSGVVTLNVGGNMNIGQGVSSRITLGNNLNVSHLINLSGNLNIALNGSLHSTGNKLGKIAFTNTNQMQSITNLSIIKDINYKINEGVHLTANAILVSLDYFLSIEQCGTLTATSLTNSNTDFDNILIKDGASLITNSVTVRGTMQRTLSNADWSVALDGWHLLSSPVAAQTLTTGGFLDTEYDFYRWSEAQNLWKNQKLSENNITSFNPGEGYFVAYDNGGTKTFTGTFNVAPRTFTNLSKTETSPYSGYHLLGNPFPCAIDWGSAGWNRSSFSDVANVWNEAAMNYLPVTLTTNNIIPANQGFFVQALSGINSITIPATARTHSNIAFNKKTEVADILHLKVVEEDNGTWDETIICIDSEATSDFDNMDGHEMQGSENAPQLYTVLAENEMLCVNALSANDIPTFIPLHFRPGAGSNYTIEVLENTIFRPIYLEDLQTGSVLLLEKTTSFSFSAADSDTRERFRLHMDPVSLPENGPHSTLSVYSSGNTIYFKDSSGKVLKGEYAVTDLTGKVLHCGILYNRSLVTIQLHNRPTGVYLVAVTLDDRQEVYKIYLQN